MLNNVKVHKYGDHVDTDTILPGRYLDLRTEAELAPYCLAGLDADFVGRAKPGDVIVGGKNFGTGSSREHAPLAIKGNGVSCIVAINYARIFYRNAINIGLPVFECPDLVADVAHGDTIDVNATTGTFVLNGKLYQAKPFAPSVKDIIEAGGLVQFVRQRTQPAFPR